MRRACMYLITSTVESITPPLCRAHARLCVLPNSYHLSCWRVVFGMLTIIINWLNFSYMRWECRELFKRAACDRDLFVAQAATILIEIIQTPLGAIKVLIRPHNMPRPIQ